MENNDAIREKLEYILKQFRIDGELIIYRHIPSGHINTAYYTAVYDGKEVCQYLIQMINTYVFKDPDSMMNNIELITGFIIGQDENLERRRRLHFHHTDEGKNFIVIGEGEKAEYWRLYNYVENSVSFETAAGNPEVLRMAGKAFGRFENQLGAFDASQLVESIPHFHDTRRRLDTFFDIVEKDPVGRAKDVQDEINLIRENYEFGCTLCEWLDNGDLPLRVTHNDTKTNNVLFDKDTLDPLVIIDLDTCMPGLACHDFGDTIRFAATPGGEDETDQTKNVLDINLYRAFTEGFIKEMNPVLTDKELDSMSLGAAIITLELASRFLADYLDGDKYFRIDFPEHNLVRTRSQLSLFVDMKKNLDEMNKIVHEVAGR